MLSFMIGLITACVCMLNGTDPMAAVDYGLNVTWYSAAICSGISFSLGLIFGLLALFADEDAGAILAKAAGVLVLVGPFGSAIYMLGITAVCRGVDTTGVTSWPLVIIGGVVMLCSIWGMRGMAASVKVEK